MRNGYGILNKDGQENQCGLWLNGKLDKKEEKQIVMQKLKSKYPKINEWEK